MAAFITGSTGLFLQASAPTGWTKSTTNDDYTLRLINGSTGGTLTNSTGLSTALINYAPTITAPGSVNMSFTPAVMDTPGHNHPYAGVSFNDPVTVKTTSNTPGGGIINGTGAVGGFTSSSYGGNGSHSHNMSGSMNSTVTGGANFSIKYVDFILATKQ